MDDQAPNAAPKSRWFRSVILAIAASLAFFVWFVAFRSPNVRMSLTPTTDGVWLLDIHPNSRINYVMGAWMGSKGVDRKELWESPYGRVFGSKKDPPRIEFRPPSGGRIGEEFFIEIAYQYDSAFPPAACSSSQQFNFRIASDGSAEYLGEGRETPPPQTRSRPLN